MSMQQYAEYKFSGIPWIGSIPFHWDVSKIKQIVSTPVTDGPHETPEFLDEGIPFVSAEAVSSGKIDFKKIRGCISEEDHHRFCKKYKPTLGDIFLVKSGASTGTVAIVEDDQEFNIWSPLAAIRCGAFANTRFVLHYLRSRNFQEGVTLNWSFGTQQNIGMNVIENLAVVTPPLPEQRSIAAFLDAETSKIDALVAEQRRLIELLKEKRQAVISHAVTKGLNPHVKMKPSGIDWLGDVPEHWKVPPVFARYSCVLGKMLDERKQSGDFGLPYLRNADVNWDRINIDGLPLIDIKPEEYDRFTLQNGDILICEGGAGIGQTAIWQGGLELCAFQKALHRLRPWKEELENPRFFYYCMSYFVHSGIALRGGTATIPHLTGEQLRKYRLPRPPKSEQDAIVDFLDLQTKRFIQLEDDAGVAISLLQERRTALISAAVTGKIDVRGFVKKGKQNAALCP